MTRQIYAIGAYAEISGVAKKPGERFSDRIRQRGHGDFGAQGVTDNRDVDAGVVEGFSDITINRFVAALPVAAVDVN
jgi:hypothetical protein